MKGDHLFLQCITLCVRSGKLTTLVVSELFSMFFHLPVPLIIFTFVDIDPKRENRTEIQLRRLVTQKKQDEQCSWEYGIHCLKRDLENLDQNWTYSKDKLYHLKSLVLVCKHTIHHVKPQCKINCYGRMFKCLNPTAQKARKYPCSFSINTILSWFCSKSSLLEARDFHLKVPICESVPSCRNFILDHNAPVAIHPSIPSGRKLTNIVKLRKKKKTHM